MSEQNKHIVSIPCTLRDYFAAKALPQMISWDAHSDLINQREIDSIAATCYSFADAMLRVRNQ